MGICHERRCCGELQVIPRASLGCAWEASVQPWRPAWLHTPGHTPLPGHSARLELLARHQEGFLQAQTLGRLQQGPEGKDEIVPMQRRSLVSRPGRAPGIS